ncbi:MAG TPA: radical SAM protein [Terriglobia bacterium]|nr:radical SAM protein [Terriglobia bacterium]
MKKKVVLFYPPYGGPPLGAPLCLLHLAAPLVEAGFDVAVIDGAIEPDYEQAVAREVEEALCFGVSLLTGPMIGASIRMARLVRKARPGLPIIFGGWHPSLVPDQTLRPDFVDVIVRGQGELTLLEIAERLAEGKNLDGVRGASTKRDGHIVHEAERSVENLNNLPKPAYHLADFDGYARARGKREMGYATSLGCPYACNYCTDQVFYKRRFNAYKAERVVDDVAELVERYRLDEVPFLDSNFPVDSKRAVAIARGLIERKVNVRWTVQASTDLLCRLSDEDVCLLRESGLYYMGFGTESASQEVLALMNKKHERVRDMYETARKTEKAGMRVNFNLILGYPGETESDRVETFRIMSDIARRHSNVSFSPNIFTPYPGIPIWPQLKQMGVREPQSLEEWNDLPLGSNVLPWLQGAELGRLRRMLDFFLINNHIRKAARGRRWLNRTFRLALGAPLRWRLRNRRFEFPVELWALSAAGLAGGVVTKRSLVTGQPLAHRTAEVC